MTIQWYPGHMAKAKRQFQEKLKLVDIVFELRDARVPESSRNPDIEELTIDKPKLIILMKRDLADESVTQSWLSYYQKNQEAALAINVHDNKQWRKIYEAAKQALQSLENKREERGLQNRAIRAVVVGVPNVGKSSLINRIAGRKAARAANTPGVTQQQQWIKWGKELELLDTPGMLWPKFEKQDIGYRLALTGAIPDRLLHMDDIALYAMKELKKYYPGALSKRYKLDGQEENMDLPDLLLEITKIRGFRDDYERGASMLVNEVRKGILGEISFDRPDEELWKEL